MHAAQRQDSGPQWQLSQDITFGYCSMPTSIGCWPRTRWCPSGLVELPDFHAHVMSQLPSAASGQKALWSLLPLNTFPRLFHKVRGVSPLKSMPQTDFPPCRFFSSTLLPAAVTEDKVTLLQRTRLSGRKCYLREEF